MQIVDAARPRQRPTLPLKPPATGRLATRVRWGSESGTEIAALGGLAADADVGQKTVTARRAVVH
jgi:hypothetical protein